MNVVVRNGMTLLMAAGCLLVVAVSATPEFNEAAAKLIQASDAPNAIFEASIYEHSKIFEMAASVKHQGVESKKLLRSEASTDDANAPSVGYFLVSFFSQGDKCNGPEVKAWQKYGTCIRSTSGGGGSSGTSNSFMYTLDSVINGVYSVSKIAYTGNNCNTQVGFEDYEYTVGDCVADGKAKFTGLASSFVQESGGPSSLSFNTQATCTSGSTDDIITATWAKLGTCYVFGTGSIKFDSDCLTADLFATTDCSGLAIYSGSYFEACDLTTDDIFTDDAYEAIEFKNTTCVQKTSGAAASSSAMRVPQLALALALVAVLMM